jgi:hypothetical protein
MGLISSFANMATKAAQRAEKQAVHAAGFASRRAAKATNAKAYLKASSRMETVASKSSIRAARMRYAAGQLNEVDKGVRTVTAPLRPLGRMAGDLASGTAINAGRVATGVARYPWVMGTGTAAVGVVAGVASGVRGTIRDANKRIGDPVGTYADMSVKTAFGGNPSDSRSKRGGASGDITLNMGKR